MFVCVAFMLLLIMSSHAVKMIKHFSGDGICRSLSFYGDVVYIENNECVVQWNVVTDAVVRLEEYDSLNLLHLHLRCSSNYFKVVFMLLLSPLTVVL
jgi:hypothetical protein